MKEEHVSLLNKYVNTEIKPAEKDGYITSNKPLKSFHPDNRKNCIETNNNDAVSPETWQNIANGEQDDSEGWDRIEDSDKSQASKNK